MSFFITSCGQDNVDLKHYIAKIKARPAQAIEPMPDFVSVPVFKFPEHGGRRSPFKPTEQKKVDDVAPDSSRAQQPLERFPLDALKFIGLLKQGNQLWALIQDPEKKVTSIKIGGYMGQNYGQVISITGTEIKLQELIKTSGLWEKHLTSIPWDTRK